MVQCSGFRIISAMTADIHSLHVRRTMVIESTTYPDDVREKSLKIRVKTSMRKAADLFRFSVT